MEVPAKVKNEHRQKQQAHNDAALTNPVVNGTTTATQTTLPKTRHQRPFGWDKEEIKNINENLQSNRPPSQPPCRFSSLPYGSHQQPIRAFPPTWLPLNKEKTSNTNCVGVKTISPSIDYPKNVPLLGMPTDFVSKPYNEHPVTIYPGPNIQYNKQALSPTSPKNGPISLSFNMKSSAPLEIKKSKSKLDIPFDDDKSLPTQMSIGPKSDLEMKKHGDTSDILVTIVTKSYNNCDNDSEHFSDDSLEESLPQRPPPENVPFMRNSIAWEVPLDEDDICTVPSNTRAFNLQRRKSGETSHSSTSSISQHLGKSTSAEWNHDEHGDYWPPPPVQCFTEDELVSPFSDTESEHLPVSPTINTTGTYIIRRGRSRKEIPQFTNSPEKITKPPLTQCESFNHDLDKYPDDSSLSVDGSGISDSHNSVSSSNSCLNSDLSLPHSRFSIDMTTNNQNKELGILHTRPGAELSSPIPRQTSEFNIPHFRKSLDLTEKEKLPQEELPCTSPTKNPGESNSLKLKHSAINAQQSRFTDAKKYSTTFDNIKSLMTDNKSNNYPTEAMTAVEGSSDKPNTSPSMLRVGSLPSLPAENELQNTNRTTLITTVEEEDDQEGVEQNSSVETSPLRKIENNISAILNQGRDHFVPYVHRDWNIHRDEYTDPVCKLTVVPNDIQKSSSHNEILSQISERPLYNKSGCHTYTGPRESPICPKRPPTTLDSPVSNNGDFSVNVHIVEHPFKNYRDSSIEEFGPLPLTPESPKFPPLPPSPVQEVDDEYLDILLTTTKSKNSKADTLPTVTTLCKQRSSEPPIVPPHRDASINSLKTRSMDTAYSRSRRNSNLRNSPGDGRIGTLTETGSSSSRRRTYHRHYEATPPGRSASLHTSASLPETPIFARGADMPRTPHRHILPPRQSTTMNSIPTIGGTSSLSGCIRGGSLMGIERTELLRLPARGWYPKQRNRPTSIENIDNIATVKSESDKNVAWDGSASRKPLTLPPNLTPKFFQKSPREALRRVTSLLIRKGYPWKSLRK